MTLEQAIEHAEEVTNKCQNFVTAHKEDRELGFIQKTEKCAEEHRQLAAWLRELQEMRKDRDYWQEKAHSYEQTIYKLTCAISNEFDYQYCAFVERRTE